MKNKMKLGMCSALLIGSLVGGGLGTGDSAAYASSIDVNTKVAQQVASPFKDVKTDYYAFDAIVWGKDKGLIGGYTDSKGKPNGKFGPNDNVTEAQFVKMVSNYLGIKDTAGNINKNKNNGSHWSDSNYDAMAKHGVPLNGYFDNVIRNKAMKRGSVAQVLAYLLGEQTNLNDSINFLLSTGVTSGQNPQYEGKDLNKFFGSTNNLTRGQVITFLYRMDSKNINNLSSLADMSASDSNNLNVKAKEGYSYVDVSLGGSKSNTGNVGNNNNGKYDDFFGEGSNNNDTTNPTTPTKPVVEKDLADYDKIVKNSLSTKSYNAIINNGMKPVSHRVGKNTNSVSITYSVVKKLSNGNNNTEEITILLNSSNSKIVRISTDYYNDTILTIIADTMGISKSKLSFSKADEKLSNSNFEILYYVGGYSLSIK